MTEAEAKVIELDQATAESRFCSAHQEPCLQCYSGLMSRLLAAEAEAGPLEVIHQWARLQPVPIAVDQAMRALDRLRGPAAPPSPPVAPEPAQEDEDEGDFPPFGVDPGDSVALEKLRMAIDDHLIWPSEAIREAGDYEAAVRHSGELALRFVSLAEPAQEAGGVERVSHDVAYQTVMHRVLQAPEYKSAIPTLLRYIDQQQASSNALRYWSTRARELEQNLQTERAYKVGAQEKQRQAESDRDAERTQKEALRIELERVKLDFANSCDVGRRLESALAEAQAKLAEAEKQLEEVCDVLYNTGATRGDALTRAKRALESYHQHINDEIGQHEDLAEALGCLQVGDSGQYEPTASFDTLCALAAQNRKDLAALAKLDALRKPPQQPTEAAPVAKEPRVIAFRGSVTDLATDVAFELTPEQADELIEELERFRSSEPTKFRAAPVAKAEAPSEPAGWVPKVGDPVTSWRTPKFGRGVIVAIPSQTLAGGVDDCDVEFEGGRVREVWLSSLVQAPLEPAPQPPATTEGAAEKLAQAKQKEPHVHDPLTMGDRETCGPCNPAGERGDFVSGRLRWHGGADLTICLVPWHRVQEPNGPQAATAEDLEEFGWVPKPTDPAPPQLQGDGVELRSQFIDAFCSAENLWTQGKTHEALGQLSTAVAKLAKALGVES